MHPGIDKLVQNQPSPFLFIASRSFTIVEPSTVIISLIITEAQDLAVYQNYLVQYFMLQFTNVSYFLISDYIKINYFNRILLM